MNEDFSSPPSAGFPPVQPPVPPTSGSRWPLFLGIFAGIAVIGLLFCCGGFALVFNYGTTMVVTEVRADLEARPEIQENIGEIKSFSMNYTRSGLHDDDDTFIYDIEGTLGSGSVTVKQYTDDNNQEVIEAAELTMEDGRNIKIDL